MSTINKEDIDDIYLLIKGRDEPVFFDYIINYIAQKREEEINPRLIEQELSSKLEADKRFLGFSDYYWYLSELVPDKTLATDRDLDKIERYISASRETISIAHALSSMNKEGDTLFKNCLTYKLHEDERFLLVDKDLWFLKNEVNKRVFRTPQETIVSELPPEPVSIVDLATALDNILCDVKEVSQKRDAQDFSSLKSKPSPIRYSLSDADVSGGCMRVLPCMRHYFPDHPMLIQIKACGTLKEYTAYVNNRTGYIRGIEGIFKDNGLNRGDVILIIPLDIEKRVYRFFSRKEKNSYPNESWRIKQFQQLKKIYEKTPISITNLVLQVVRTFQDLEVHFDSIYDEVNAICPVSKEVVAIILEKLPFCNKGIKTKDFWVFDDNKFNKFLILGLTSLISESSALPAADDKEKAFQKLLKVREEKIKELEVSLEAKENFVNISKNEAEDAKTKMKAFEKLSDVRVQQIDSLNKNVETLEKKVAELVKELGDAKKSPSDADELRNLKKKMLSLQDVFLNKKKMFMQLEKEKKELEKALLEMDKITSGLEKEKADYLKQIENARKDLEEARKSTGIQGDKFSSQSVTIEEQAKKIEELQSIITEKETKLTTQEEEIIQQKEEIERKEEEIIQQKEEIERKLEEIETLKKDSYQEETGEPPVPAFEIDTPPVPVFDADTPPVPAFDVDLSGEYELKLSEKDQKIKEIESKVSQLERLKVELEDEVRNQKENLAKMSSLIAEKEAIIKDQDAEKGSIISDKDLAITNLEKELDELKKSSSSKEDGMAEELKERIDGLEQELESKTNLYNTNLNMQFKLNKDIYKLQKKVDVFRDIILFFSEALPFLPGKENLNLSRIDELMGAMKGEEMEEDTVAISGLKTLEDTFDRLNKMLHELEESNNLFKEELEIFKGFKESFEEEQKKNEEINQGLEKLNNEHQDIKAWNGELRHELERLSKIPIFGGMVKKLF